MRRINSFGKNRGRRLGETSQDLLDNFLPELSFSYPPKNMPLWLEIGFGSGEHLCHLAKNNPDKEILGAEVYLNGVTECIKQISREKIENIKISILDARDLLETIPDNSLERVFVLYPDPWPKRKHYKRRLIQLGFLRLIAQKLLHGGALNLMTDIDDYAEWMCIHAARINELRFEGGWQNPPHTYITTKYAEKALAAGRTPVFLNFKKDSRRP